ncbi:phosphopantothenoylcysteine decarboxylase/phosphopantothenate/cysteine ligase [Thermodesulfobium narugense DSM 14796]|uniref:Coenzyme A biosynthesis bifunctional protein CoaBC n=1 Tax=Thermodesulfobium narugense DSM 14796 TaxID=747365 RepID=M1E5Q5_9BACT|nr:bifunctional phosphopantothenoylcysteine decarboxylase/phosphopantothenate--cysteine ligase CoaBC [Thermodesulfobium narugense]AEE14421.1 phosphopantothenoylcysteine decarboxylase/phosphopantothenate/cysteine ligase [Thermodesulfobium narugense DSM 14796]
MKILFGICGGISAYKAASFVSSLVKEGNEVNVVMTQNATRFVSPLTFEALTKNVCYSDSNLPSGKDAVAHITLPQSSDVFVICPATANTISKIALGIADNLLTTMAIARKCPLVLVPAMNDVMWSNPSLQDNVKRLLAQDVIFFGPTYGRLACESVGSGRMLEVSELLEMFNYHFYPKKDFVGKRILITAGPTREPIDPVRYISNRSSGKMGFAFAQIASLRGAQVKLISGPTSLSTPYMVERIDIETTEEMLKSVLDNFEFCDVLVMAAAVSDFKVDQQSSKKIKKKNSLELNLIANPDILKEISSLKKNQVVIGFAAETENLSENASKKLVEKKLDYIVANRISETGFPFGSENNEVLILSASGECYELNSTKIDIASFILDIIKERISF